MDHKIQLVMDIEWECQSYSPMLKDKKDTSENNREDKKEEERCPPLHYIIYRGSYRGSTNISVRINHHGGTNTMPDNVLISSTATCCAEDKCFLHKLRKLITKSPMTMTTN